MEILKFILYSTLGLISVSLDGVFITTQDTPPKLLLEIEYFRQKENIFSTTQILVFSSELEDYLKTSRPTYIIDATWNLLSERHILVLSQDLEIIIFLLRNRVTEIYTSNWIFYPYPKLEKVSKAFESLIDHFSWSSLHVFSSESTSSFELARNFIGESSFNIEGESNNILSNSLSESSVTDYFGRIIKPSGVWKFLIFNEKESVTSILKSVQKLNMYSKNCGVILKFWSLDEIPEGVIGLTEKGTENAKSYEDFQLKSLEEMIELLHSFKESFSGSFVSSRTLRDLLEKSTNEHFWDPEYLILNSKTENSFEEVGSVSGNKVIFTANLTLPGGQTTFSNDLIEISYTELSGVIDYNRNFDYETYRFFGGIPVIIDLINEDPYLLENFSLVKKEVPCSTKIFEYDWYKECILSVGELGLFMLQSVQNNLQIVHLLREMEINIFQHAYLALNEELYEKEAYPEIVFINQSKALLYGILPTWLTIYRWYNIIALESFSESISHLTYVFYEKCEELGIKVHNREDQRVFIDNYTTKGNFTYYEEWFQNYYDSGVRVVVVLGGFWEYQYLVESFHKIGFRKGDIQLVTIFDYLTLISVQYDPEIDTEVVEELVDGSIWIAEAEYIDEFETNLKPLVEEAMGTTLIDSTCFAIDMLQIAVHAVDSLLVTGREYENPEIVGESVRDQRFLGCSGMLSIDSSSNQRRDMTYYLGNFYLDKITGDGTRNLAGTYSAIQNPLFIFTSEFIFSNGLSTPPEDMRIEKWDCDFEKKEIRKSEKSQNMSLILLIPVCVGAILFSSFIVWFFGLLKTIELSQERNVMGLDDVIFILSILIENIQYLIIGPEFSYYNEFLYKYFQYFSLSINIYYDWEFEIFWIWYQIFIGLINLEIVITLCYILSFYRRCPEFMKNLSRMLGEKLMPGLLNLFFVPLLLVVFSMFDCPNSIGEDLTDAYLEKDCNTFCWKGSHLKFVIGALFAIFFYITFSILYRCFFSIFHSGRTIRFSPEFALTKTVFQVLFALLSYSIKKKYSSSFNLIFVFLIGVCTYLYHRIRIFNFEKLEQIEVACGIGVFWSMILTSVLYLVVGENVGEREEICFCVLEVGGWSVVAVCWFLLNRKYPSMFKKIEAKFDLILLFKFMFGKVDKKTLYSQKSSSTPYSFQEERKYPIESTNIIKSSGGNGLINEEEIKYQYD